MSRSAHSVRAFRNAGGLATISAALILSGLLRVGGANLAFASAEIPQTSPAHEVSDTVPRECKSSRDVEQMLASISDRQAQLDQRERRLENRMQALNVAENRLKENTQRLIDAENRLSETLAIADSAAEDDLARLTAVYENMKPKQATGLFEKMAPEFAAGFLGRMRADSAAAVMATLSPEKAYKISVILAGRNARAPTN